MPPCGHLLYPACGCPAPAPTPPAKTPTAVELARAALAANPTPPVLPNVRPPIRATHEVVGPRSVAVKLPPAPPSGGRRAVPNIDDIKRQMMRDSFARFFREAWKEVEPATELVWNWHLQLMCNVLQAVFMDWQKSKTPGHQRYQNLIRNVIFNVPPGSSKSKVIAVCFHAWMWMHAPGMKLIALSVNDDAAMRDARDARKLINSTWYRDNFKTKFEIKGDQDAISNFGNTLGGERLSMPSKSVVTGLRGDCLIIDDANSPSENDHERDIINGLWDDNQSNRVNDMAHSIRLGVQQRTNTGDWTGHVIGRQGLWSPDNISGWLHVVLPAEYEAARKFIMPKHLVDILGAIAEGVTEDPRTVEGESIDKVRMPPSVIEAERKRWAGTANFAGQLQQRPAAIEGARIKRDYWGWFRLEAGVRDDVDDLPNGRPRPVGCERNETITINSMAYSPGQWSFDWVIISLDCAVKKTEKGSAWGILVIGGKDGRRYVLDNRTRRGDILEIIEVLRELVKLWQPDKFLIEDKAAGPDLKLRLLEQMSKGAMAMIELVEVKVGPNAGKEERLDACLPTLANGLVYLLEGAPWLEEFVEETSTFPNSKQSDQVDALTQALNHFAADEDPGSAWPSW